MQIGRPRRPTPGGPGGPTPAHAFAVSSFHYPGPAVACLSVIMIPPSPIFLSPNLHRGFPFFPSLFSNSLLFLVHEVYPTHSDTFTLLISCPPSVFLMSHLPLRTIGEGDVVYTVGFLIRSDPLWLGHSLSSVILGLGSSPKLILIHLVIEGLLLRSRDRYQTTVFPLTSRPSGPAALLCSSSISHTTFFFRSSLVSR